MIQGKSILGIIPARGGSKGIPRKNIKEIAGKPLIAWTSVEASKSRYIDRLILSSEDEEIIRVAKQWNCEVPFIRPDELAKDNTPGIDPVLHAIKTLQKKYDYIVVLQPTSPLRLVDDIDRCIEICIYSKVSSCVSVTEVSQHPYWMYRINNHGFLSRLIEQEHETYCRQELPRVYLMNGAVYVAEVSMLTDNKSLVSYDTMGYIMPQERSLDLDREIDFKIAEYMIYKKMDSS